MTDFHSVFSIGYKRERLGSGMTPEFRQSSLAQNIGEQDKGVFAQLLGVFARSHLGMTLVNRFDPRGAALATTNYPQREHEIINWGLPLFDSEGFEHTLIDLGGIEVVTKQGFAYCVWERATGRCRRAEATDLILSNTPLTPERREQMAYEAAMALGALEAGRRQRAF
ncbi:MAG TPA: hypothetical protein VN259_07530 [Xanthomonadales bacterium]|nr:hypothetical protein [Xanthomonadales bacterium]